MNHSTQTSHLATLLKMRLVVGFLGERAQFAWWPTAFYEPSGRVFLEPVFSKTSRAARYHGVLEAARRIHDEHLSVGTYHLFRLPEEVEQDLHGLALSGSTEALPLEDYENREGGMNVLKALAATNMSESDGPTTVGNIADLSSGSVLKTLAAVYHSAFSRGTKAYPYLVR